MKHDAYNAEFEKLTVVTLKKLAKASDVAQDYFGAAKLGKIKKRHYVDALSYAKCVKEGKCRHVYK